MSNVLNVKTVLAISCKRGAWGAGATASEAVRNLKAEAGSWKRGDPVVLVLSDAPRDQVTIESGVDLRYSVPVGFHLMRLDDRA